MSLIQQLKKHEGYRKHPYKCTAGKVTIGIGRNLDDVGISEQEAEYLLMNDIVIAEKELHREFPFTKKLDEARHDVLVNMVFNMGIGRLKNFKKTMKAIEFGKYDIAAAEMLDSKWAIQVGIRAMELSRQMATGREVA